MRHLKRVFYDWGNGLGRAEYFIGISSLVFIQFLTERLFLVQFNSRQISGKVYIQNTLIPFGYEAGLEPLSMATLASIPFIWLALHWTSRRIRSAGLSQWLTPVTLVPIVNLILFASLSFFPTRRVETMEPQLIRLDGAGFAVWTSSLLGLATTWFGAEHFHIYGFGLFHFAPIGIGAFSCIVFQAESRKSWSQCNWTAIGGTSLTALLAIALGLEGAICLLMAAPLLALETLVGVLLGRLLLTAIRSPYARTVTSFTIPALLFMTIFVEGTVAADYPTHVATTEMIVTGTLAEVWPQVIAYKSLPAPTEPLFIAGLAYPFKVTMAGEGVGANRICHLSTGPMPEVVTAWEKEKLLRFKVLSTPPSMKELSPWKIDPPHLHGFLNLLQGEIILEQLPGNKIRLVGRSWYKLRLEPQWYWRLWTDEQIHAIHRRAFQAVRT